MRRLNTDNHGSQKGMTLVETLVAVVVFSVVFLAALGLYQAANRAYLATDAATIQQQNARFAMDRVSETLRDAGANYNTTGKSLVADEQIEGAWESAIFVRGDFDNSPETALQSSPNYPIVSTGNDEIVGYVLRKEGANTITINIKADMSIGRNAVKTGPNAATGEETPSVQVAAINLAQQTNPPYQLTRVSFNDAGVATYQVIADNIFRLSFKHMNAEGVEVIDADTATGSGDAERDERATIRKIGVSIITMADRPDLGYTDPKSYTTDAFGHVAPAAAASSVNRRKFTLTEEIFGISLGRKGARHNAVPAININPPAALTVCTGHHLNYYLKWPASTTPDIATYQVSITRGTPPVTFTVLVPTTEYRFRQTTTTVEPHTFKVAGAAGTAIGATYSPAVTKTATHEAPSIPAVPVNVLASGSAGANALNVTWDPVTTNTGPITTATCTTEGAGAGTSVPPSPWDNAAVDLSTHQVYRGLVPKVANGTFNTASGGRRVDGVPWGDITNGTPTALNTFTDNTAAPCGKYFYRVKSVDSDNKIAAGDGSLAMAAAASYIPDAGITPAKPSTPAPTGAVAVVGSEYQFTLGWNHVLRDSAGNKAATAHYEIVKERNIGGAGWVPMTSDHVYEANVSAQSGLPQKQGTADIEYRFAVKALYDCGTLGNVDRPNQSDWYLLACTPHASNTITITVPGNGSSISHPYETVFTPTLTTTGTDWTGVQLTIAGPDGQPVSNYPPVTYNTAPPWTFPQWDSEQFPPGTYTVTAVGTAGQCRGNPVTSAFRIETGTCGLSISSPSWTSTNGNSAFTALQFRVVNNCDLTGLTIRGLELSWSGTGSPNPHITGITYNGISYAANLNSTTGQMGTAITFSGSQTAVVGAGATSNLFVVTFSDNMTSDLGKDGTPASFSSIIAAITAPETSREQIVDTPPLTP